MTLHRLTTTALKEQGVRPFVAASVDIMMQSSTASASRRTASSQPTHFLEPLFVEAKQRRVLFQPPTAAGSSTRRRRSSSKAQQQSGSKRFGAAASSVLPHGIIGLHPNRLRRRTDNSLRLVFFICVFIISIVVVVMRSSELLLLLLGLLFFFLLFLCLQSVSTSHCFAFPAGWDATAALRMGRKERQRTGWWPQLEQRGCGKKPPSARFCRLHSNAPKWSPPLFALL